jgi:hypothetical protein
MDEITADCPRKRARNDSDPCGAICLDLQGAAVLDLERGQLGPGPGGVMRAVRPPRIIPS